MSSIVPKLVAAAKAVGFGVEKDGSIRGMYDYTSSAGVLRKIGPALAAQGIALTVELDILPQSTVESVMLKVKVTYHADGCEPLSTWGGGVGKASGRNDEKALLKAQSSAIKYAHILAFSLAMGFDPEEDDGKEEEPEEPAGDLASTRLILEAYRAAKTIAEGRNALEMVKAAWPRLNGDQRAKVSEASARAAERLKGQGDSGPDAGERIPRPGDPEYEDLPMCQKADAEQAHFYGTKVADVIRAFDHAQRLTEINDATPLAMGVWPDADEDQRARMSDSFVRASRRCLGRPPLRALAEVIDERMKGTR